MSSVPEAAKPMNLWSVTALGIGAMVGAGIFALLGEAAVQAGRETFLTFLLGGVVAQLSGYSYAKLAARYPDAGGIATYLDAGYGAGRFAGTVSIMFFIIQAAAIALVAKAFGAYAASLVLGTTSPMWSDALATAVVLVFVALNAGNEEAVGKVEIVLVVIKLVILVVLAVAGFSVMFGKPAVEHPGPGFIGLVDTVGLTFLAYAGYGLMTNAAASVARPEAVIPRAILIAVSTVMVLYVALAIVVVGSLTPAELARYAGTAVAEAAKPVLGQAGFVIVSIGALLATASAINTTMYGMMQMSTALARTDHLPRMFGERLWGSCTRGMAAAVVALLIVMNIFNLNALAHIVSATFLIAYLAVHVAHWRLLDQTGGSRLLVALGILAMAGVLALFLWSTALTQPWSFAMIVLFVVVSWATQLVLLRP
ncbi:MAG: APC family permease [Reyranellaceae bacterium]